jgi:hypothetical protein
LKKRKTKPLKASPLNVNDLILRRSVERSTVDGRRGRRKKRAIWKYVYG